MAAYARVPRDSGFLFANAANSVQSWDRAHDPAEITRVELDADPDEDGQGDGKKLGGRNRKKPKWKKLDLESIDTSPATITGDSLFPAVFPPLADLAESLTPASGQPRARAPSGPLQPFATAEPHPTSANRNDTCPSTEQPATPAKTRPRRKRRRNKPHQAAEMTTTSPTPCFIPPHLRKRTTTDPATSAKSPASSSLEPPAPAPKSPPSPPSSPELVLGAWDEPVPVAANAPPRNSKWPKQPPRRTPWPKNRDMRPVDHSSDGGVDCWENFSNGNSDPDRDVKQLIDWEGKWLPAPEQWNDRNGFTDRHFRDNIEAWINSTHKECTEFIIVEDAANLPTKEFGAGRELAPRFWIPVRIDGSAPQQFWESLPTRAPKPLSEVDLAEAQPWWDTYPDATPYLSPLDVPEARVDAREEENRRPGVSLSSIETGEKIKRAKQARIDRIMAKRNGPSPAPKVEVPPEALIVPDISLRPKVNIYLRPVSPTDVAQITDIYNYYVTNTIKANEFNARSHTHIAGRINDIINCGLPWIVAVDKALQPANHLFNFVHEKIVGFVSLDDHCDPGSMYRFTYEMEMFVHPGYLNKGVGKCLLDRLLSIVNTGYTAKRGYEWRCPGEYLRNDAGRVIKTINVTVPLDHDNVDEIKWVTAFFRAFDFRKSGHLMKMAYKLGKTVDVCIYQHHTTEEINSNAIPQRPL